MVLTKKRPRVCNTEEIISCSRVLGKLTFLQELFFWQYFFTFLQHKEDECLTKFMAKKVICHHGRLGENGHLFL